MGCLHYEHIDVDTLRRTSGIVCGVRENGRCSCGAEGTRRCDWKTSKGEKRPRRCNAWVCDAHATHVGEDKDLCHAHAQQWGEQLSREAA